MTDDPYNFQNLPQIDKLTQFRNVVKGILMNANTESQSIWDLPAFTMVFPGSKPYNCNQCNVFRRVPKSSKNKTILYNLETVREVC